LTKHQLLELVVDALCFSITLLPDPYLVISHRNNQGNRTEAHKTEVVDKNLNPEWKSFAVSVDALTSGDKDRQILFECFDHNTIGSSDEIGHFTVSICKRQQLTLQTTLAKLFYVQEFELLNVKKEKKKDYKNSGVIEVVSCAVEEIALSTNANVQKVKSMLKQAKPQDLIQYLMRVEYSDRFRLELQGKNLEKMDTFGKSGKQIHVPFKFQRSLHCNFSLGREWQNSASSQNRGHLKQFTSSLGTLFHSP
jgi:hypothetical protein